MYRRDKIKSLQDQIKKPFPPPQQIMYKGHKREGYYCFLCKKEFYTRRKKWIFFSQDNSDTFCEHVKAYHG